MKNFNKIIAGLAVATLLAGCGTKAVSYEKFHEKAVASQEIRSNFDYDTATVTGSYNVDSTSIALDHVFYSNGTLKEGSVAYASIALMLLNIHPEDVSEAENTTYTFYVNNGFKAVAKTETSTATMTWNKYGLCISNFGEGTQNGVTANVDVKISYK